MKLFGATIALSALLLENGASAGSSSETKQETKRLRKGGRAVYRSKSGTIRNAATNHDIPLTEQQQRELNVFLPDFGSYSIPMVSFSFSLNIPGVTGGIPPLMPGPVIIQPISASDPDATSMSYPMVQQPISVSNGEGELGPVVVDEMSIPNQPIFDATMPTMPPSTDVLVGTGYCTYGPDKSCYTSGWPICCGPEGGECPEEQPSCEVTTTSTTEVTTASTTSATKTTTFTTTFTTTSPPESTETTQVTSTTTAAEEPYDPCMGMSDCMGTQSMSMVTTSPPTNPVITTSPNTATAEPMCEFCANGVTADPEYVIDAETGATCEQVNAFAPTIAASDTTCGDVKQAEFLCCSKVPTVACNFCTDNGITVTAGTVIPDGSETTCETLDLFAKSIEDTSADCTGVQDAEFVCCPTAPTDPCTFCAGGLTVDPSTVTEDNGITCATAAIFAASTNGTSGACSAVQMAEAACCPPVEVMVPWDGMSMSMSMNDEPTSLPTKIPTASPVVPVGSPTMKNPTDSPVPPTPREVPPPSSAIVMGTSCLVGSILAMVAGFHLL